MGVFTTQTLLNSVGVSRNQSAPGAVAINWILKVTTRTGEVLHFIKLDKHFCIGCYMDICNLLCWVHACICVSVKLWTERGEVVR